MVCMTIFLSAFAFENFHQLSVEKITIEIVDAENEQEGEKRDKTGEDKFPSCTSLFDFKLTAISQYNSFIEGSLKENIQEIISPPPEA